MKVKMQDKNWSFQEVYARLSNGKKVSYPIGKVSIETWKDQKDPINTLTASSSSDFNTEQLLEAYEPFTLTSLDIPLLKELKSNINIYFNHNQVLLRKLAKGLMADQVGGPLDDEINKWQEEVDQTA